MIGWTLAGTALGALALAPDARELARPRIGAAQRAAAAGQFAELPRGTTHYLWTGSADGGADAPAAVCIHGLTTPAFVWGPVAAGLARMGFRVLSYDLYGRGLSDRPGGAQTMDFFIAQLDDLLAHLGVSGRITVLGYSMGGAIAAAWAARHPDRAREAVLIAPAGMGHDLGPVARLVTNHAALGRWLILAFYARSLTRALEANRDLDSAIPDIVDRQMAELRWRGFVPAVWRSMRGILDGDMQAEHRLLAARGVPVHAIWAEADAVIQLSGKARLAEWNPAARQTVIPGATHAVTYTHPDAVLAALTALRRD